MHPFSDALRLAAFCVWALSVLIAFAFAARHYTYMLQLGSYYTKEYLHRLRTDIRHSVIFRVFPFLFAAMILFLSFIPFAARAFVSAAANLFGAWLLRPKTMKKPFVVTARVRRLFVTEGILLLLSAIGYRVFLPQLLPMLAPLTVAAACVINEPLEKAIRNRYIKEAKNILAARKNNLTVIGITGSFGKTGTKYILETILSEHFNVLKTPGSYNTPMGVVRVVREMLSPAHEIFLCEMGARHEGDIKELCDIAHPDHGIITSVGPMHLETFHDIETVARTKFELADAVPMSGFVALCGDNPHIAAREKRDNYIYYGQNPGNAFTAENVRSCPDGTTFDLCYDGHRLPLYTRLLGEHNVTNIVGACAVALRLGMNERELTVGVRRLRAVPHRLELIPSDRVTVIDDAFNANPVGAKAALDVLSSFDGLRVLVTPGLVELGEKQYEANKALGRQAAACCHLIYLVGHENEAALRDGIQEGGFDDERCFAVSSPTEAVNAVRALASPLHTYILLENDLPDNYR